MGWRRRVPRAYTKAEMAMFRELNRRHISFRTQEPIRTRIRTYLVDFLLGDLIVEVNGLWHIHETRRRKDEQRDADLAELGFRTLRFQGGDVLRNTKAVADQIIKEIKK